MTDQTPVNVKQADIDKMAAFIRDRIRNRILEHAHIYDHGAIAGMMSDLRALTFIAPVDKAAPAKVPTVMTRAEADVAQQRANSAHDKKERESIRAANA